MFNWLTRQWHRHTCKWLNHGRPPKKMDWRRAMLFGWTPFYEAMPNSCHKCGKDAEITEHAFEEIEGKNQATVVVHSCPLGHGFSVWVA